MNKIKIAPSMMCVDFLDLKSELDIFKKFGVDFLHVDIMDGHYVPNFTLGIDFCKSITSYCDIPLDFHLMVENVDNYLDIFCSIKNSIVNFHPETTRHPVRTIEKIRQSGCKPGIAIEPWMTIDSLKHLLPLVDQICVMTVSPGYAGQKLLPFCIDKISEVKSILNKHHIKGQIEVDGNVSWENIPAMVQAGADVLVVGTSSIFSTTQDRDETFSKLHKMIKGLNSTV